MDKNLKLIYEDFLRWKIKSIDFVNGKIFFNGFYGYLTDGEFKILKYYER